MNRQIMIQDEKRQKKRGEKIHPSVRMFDYSSMPGGGPPIPPMAIPMIDPRAVLNSS